MRALSTPSRLTALGGMLALLTALTGCQNNVVDKTESVAVVTAAPSTDAARKAAAPQTIEPASVSASAPPNPQVAPSALPHTEAGRSERAVLRKPKAEAESAPARTEGATAGRAPLPTQLLTSAPQTGEGYKVYARVQSPVIQGKPAAVIVHLEPQPPFKSNDKYPYRFTVNESRGVTPSSSAVTGAEVAPEKTTLTVPFRAEEVGSATLGGTFAFSVCTPEKCLIERASVVSTFEVVADSTAPKP